MVVIFLKTNLEDYSEKTRMSREPVFYKIPCKHRYISGFYGHCRGTLMQALEEENWKVRRGKGRRFSWVVL